MKSIPELNIPRESIASFESRHLWLLLNNDRLGFGAQFNSVTIEKNDLPTTVRKAGSTMLRGGKFTDHSIRAINYFRTSVLVLITKAVTGTAARS